MNQSSQTEVNPFREPRGVLFWLSLFIVIAGLMNAIPGIPGLDTSLRDLTGLEWLKICLLYTSPSPRDLSTSRMPSSA